MKGKRFTCSFMLLVIALETRIKTPVIKMIEPPFDFSGKPTIVQAPTALVSYVGQSVIFHCVVVGNPKPNVCWKNSSEIVTTRGRIEVFSNGSLKINNLLKSDDGSFFICEAKNSYGISTASATLHVNGMC